jgi:hypothetical protein
VEIVVAAAIKFQANIRRRQARKQLVVYLARAEGILLAVNGTIQGGSGWYEMDPGNWSGVEMVVKYEVVPTTGEWVQRAGPLKKSAYQEAMRVVAVYGAGGGRVGGLDQVQAGLAILVAAVKLQAIIRRNQARKIQVIALSQDGRLLAMPGTTQGRSGWYEFYREETPMVAQFSVSVEGDWELLSGGAMTKEEYANRQRK